MEEKTRTINTQISAKLFVDCKMKMIEESMTWQEIVSTALENYINEKQDLIIHIKTLIQNGIIAEGSNPELIVKGLLKKTK
jgi:hypothetical protein